MADGNINLNDFDLSKLNENDKAELRQFFANEGQKARIQTTVHSLTDMCFRKCMTSTIRSGKLDKSEEGCMVNCANRFIDVSQLTVKHLQSLRQG
ncbi:Tim10/DDP family zinc finger-domain-containing protein [Daldinia loculata]|uniref:Tim10/DDP family zinc finger-domain-containing protein n=1 Tax=Daldinia loculata TaxID=103429 RepID=UPI0020C3F20F|nr:Tim10/DDP family zinc finger-domain-containing protein [Daldinia loculata]KAI1647566.1 Tim10/DDP family zinc finger-domain-containing protein [Daldinia loculata]KAI2784984.1 Tim10/DDP family zinc finger-domain-containing protein [Daldinia loculata]